MVKKFNLHKFAAIIKNDNVENRVMGAVYKLFPNLIYSESHATDFDAMLLDLVTTSNPNNK